MPLQLSDRQGVFSSVRSIAMSRNSLPTDDSWETDAVWKLLEQSPQTEASPRFMDDTMRAARLSGQDSPWWRHLVAPFPLGMAGTAVTAALALGFFLSTPKTDSTLQPSVVSQPESSSANIAAIEELAETEALLAAVDQMDDYSDHELVTLIGF